jgi:hypothetical protein
VSLFGTTSGLLSLFAPKPRHLPGWLALLAFFLVFFFFCAGLWMSALGWGSLVSGGPSEDVGRWTLWGRPVPGKAWKAMLWFCYLTPWIAMAIVILVAGLKGRGPKA